MPIQIAVSWQEPLANEFTKPYFKQLNTFIENEYRKHVCYPSKEKIMAAFNATAFTDVKVVILGQDPYHGPNQADGLCFSVTDNTAIPPSLKNIYKEINNDIGVKIPENGNLNRWAQQGVLLLNTTLTVRAHEPRSHQGRGWEAFTDAVITTLSEKQKGIVFLLWGGYAKKKKRIIDTKKHFILTSGHPSPLSANRGYWFGNHHFSSTNNYLKKTGKSTINW